MPLNIRSEDVNRLADTLATRLKISKTEAVRRAREAALRQTDRDVPLIARIRPLQKRVLSYPRTGKKADKAFFDELSGGI